MLRKLICAAFAFGLLAQQAQATIYKCELQVRKSSWVTDVYHIAVTPSKQVKIIDRVIHQFNDGEMIVAESSEVTEDKLSFVWRIHANNANGSRLLLFTGALWPKTLEVRIDSRIINGSRKDGARGTCVVTKP